VFWGSTRVSSWPVLFSIYSSPVADIARKHGLYVQLYADDTQLYLAFHPIEVNAALAKVEACVAEIKAWMLVNKLQLNGDTTVRTETYNVEHVLIDGHPIPLSSTVKNLGVLFDEALDMEKHIKSVCRASMYHLKNIGSIRRLLSDKTAEQLVHAFVMSRLDYCNALLYGLPSSSINHLQRIQNIAARILTGTKKFDHITPVLKDLHWLPIEQRIRFKLLLLTFKGIHGMAPEYIKDLLVSYNPSRALRSSDSHRLVVPSSRLKGYGDRSFAVAAPRLWNALPEKLRKTDSLSSFKRLLKTHLYMQAYL